MIFIALEWYLVFAISFRGRKSTADDLFAVFIALRIAFLSAAEFPARHTVTPGCALWWGDKSPLAARHPDSSTSVTSGSEDTGEPS